MLVLERKLHKKTINDYEDLINKINVEKPVKIVMDCGMQQEHCALEFLKIKNVELMNDSNIIPLFQTTIQIQQLKPIY